MDKKLKTELIIGGVFVMLAIGSFYAADGNFFWLPIKEQPISNRLALLLAPLDAQPFHLDERVQTENCHVRGPLPDHECTPGAIFPEATVVEICVSGYTKTVRSVSVSLKKKVYTEYGLSYPQPKGSYEADHLIPLELGGNNDIANLFPEIGEPRPGYKEKDLVENYLHDEVCAGRVSLGSAQQQIANDWVSVYNALTPSQLEQLRAQFK